MEGRLSTEPILYSLCVVGICIGVLTDATGVYLVLYTFVSYMINMMV